MGGNDLLVGGTGDDLLYGDGKLRSLDARGGDDRIRGDEGNDVLYGEGGDDFIGSNPFFGGQAGNDRLDGGQGDDILYGDSNWVVSIVFPSGSTIPDCGDDVLTGGTGNDALYGDRDPTASNGDLDPTTIDPTNVARGADRFVFADGSGLDTIFDFENGRDLIDLTGFAGITGFEDLSPDNVTPSGVDTVIDLGAAASGAGGQGVLTLVNFAVGDLDETDFLFA